MMEPGCYQCLHRATLPGSAHSRCAHPGSGHDDNPLGALIGLLGKRLGAIAPPAEATIHVTGNPHGVAHGWFNWPWNFDPVWLESCDGFELKAVAS